MRNFSFFIILFFFIQGCTTWKLPPPKKVAVEYKKEYKQTTKDFKKVSSELKKEDWEITLDPIESIPVAMIRSLGENQNWGQLLILPDQLRKRINDECTFPVLVKVFDTGSPNHSYLANGQQPAANYTNSSTVGDLSGHATHVAGIMFGNNNLGMLSDLVANQVVIWKSVKVLGDQGQGSFSWVANAIDSEDKENKNFIARDVSVVVNGSFGGGTSLVSSVEKSLLRSSENGVHYFFASGNSGKRGVEYPAKSKIGSAVGALNQSMNPAIFSSYGPEVNYSMPGQAILSTWKGQSFATLSGTSMATPFMTSAAVIALSKWGMMNPEELQKYLAAIATDIEPTGKDEKTGWGILFIQRILNTSPTGEDGSPPNGKAQTFSSYNPNSIIQVKIGADEFEFVLKNLKADMISPIDGYETLNDYLKDRITRRFFILKEQTQEDFYPAIALAVADVIHEWFFEQVEVKELTLVDKTGKEYVLKL